MRHLILVTVALLAWFPAGAAERAPAFGKGTSYASARGRLVALGWRPAAPPVTPQDCGTGRDDMCRADQPEVKSCAGSGTGACRALWGKGDTVIEVMTVGDGKPEVRSVRCLAHCR